MKQQQQRLVLLSTTKIVVLLIRMVMAAVVVMTTSRISRCSCSSSSRSASSSSAWIIRTPQLRCANHQTHHCPWMITSLRRPLQPQRLVRYDDIVRGFELSSTTESSHRRFSTTTTARNIIENRRPSLRTSRWFDSIMHSHQRWNCGTLRLSFSSNDAKTKGNTSQDDRPKKNKVVPTTDSDDEGEESMKTMTSVWNITGLKTETYRRLERAKKKVDQFSSRIERYQAQKDKPPVNSNAHLDFDIVKAELAYGQEHLKELRRFEMLLLTTLRSNGQLEMVLPEQLAERALALNMTDHPPKRPPRGEPKPKGPRQMEPSRKPYRKYISIDNIEIRVGKKAEDNDELSINPEHRDDYDWWMHAAGCPGSHVIIRYSDRKNDPPTTTIQEAAALAAKHSKNKNSNIIKVNMCRARDIKKPPLSKPGLVLIVGGKVRTVIVDMKISQKQLDRLEANVEVN